MVHSTFNVLAQPSLYHWASQCEQDHQGDCVSALPARHNRSSISWGGGAVEASTSKEGGQRRPALAGEGIGGQHQEVGPGEVSTSRAGGQGDWRSKKGAAHPLFTACRCLHAVVAICHRCPSNVRCMPLHRPFALQAKLKCARRGLAHPLFTACRVCRANAGGLPWWWGHFGATSNWGEREVDYGGFHGVSGEPKSGANGLGACDDGRRYCVRVDFAQAAWALGTALKAQQRWGARQWVHCACRAFCTAYHTCTRAWEH
eukprot:1160176-Pelagomonas_calceolata.AAC.4